MTKGLIVAMACNSYPSSPLSQCLEDASQIVKLCRDKGWEGPARVHTNDQVTNVMLREAANWFVDEVNSGRYTNALFVVSGHGTSIPAPGRTDPTRELYCPYDIDNLWRSRELMCDDDYEAIFARLNKKLKGKVKVLFEALCCNSGGLTTTQIDDAALAVTKDPTVRVRRLRSPWEAEAASLRKVSPVRTREWRKDQRNRFIDNDSMYAYWAAARSDQYSHELTSPMWGGGDVSRLAQTAAYKDKSEITLADLQTSVQQFIDVQYQFDQCPQLWAPEWMLKEDFFLPPSA